MAWFSMAFVLVVTAVVKLLPMIAKFLNPKAKNSKLPTTKDAYLLPWHMDGHPSPFIKER
jgi:hypothetical protein